MPPVEEVLARIAEPGRTARAAQPDPRRLLVGQRAVVRRPRLADRPGRARRAPGDRPGHAGPVRRAVPGPDPGRLRRGGPAGPGLADRVPLHQLHPLLVHACLFGSSYRESCGPPGPPSPPAEEEPGRAAALPLFSATNPVRRPAPADRRGGRASAGLAWPGWSLSSSSSPGLGASGSVIQNVAPWPGAVPRRRCRRARPPARPRSPGRARCRRSCGSGPGRPGRTARTRAPPAPCVRPGPWSATSSTTLGTGLPPAAAEHPDVDRRPVGGVGERVVHQVADDLPQPGLVAEDQERRAGPTSG